MSTNAFSKLVATIFTVMAIVQLTRAVVDLPIQLGSFYVPVAISYGACAVLALLAYLGFTARNEPELK